MAEAERLVAAGVREILVISQDTRAYGVDLKYRTGFWGGRPLRSRFQDLVQALGELGIWIRLHYPYPHVDEVILLMAEGKVLPYLDVPFQHANARILKAMRRPGDAEGMLERIRDWRAVCPDLALRSTFIVGFPGETEAEFQELLDFLAAAQLDRAGCFEYSPVEGAAANALPDPVPEEVKGNAGGVSWKRRPRSARRGYARESAAPRPCWSMKSWRRESWRGVAPMHRKSTGKSSSMARPISNPATSSK
jgi:ribosomal protein S12 methylthiotransferase